MSASNRAERRRQKAQWRRDMHRMGREAAGIWTCELIRPDSPHRPETVLATLRWFTALRSGRTLSPLCALCDAEFTWPEQIPAAMLFLAPGRDAPSTASITGICAKHAALPDAELMDAAFRFFKRSFLPDARRLDPAHLHTEAGRA
jgi:hypothetical protein